MSKEGRPSVDCLGKSVCQKSRHSSRSSSYADAAAPLEEYRPIRDESCSDNECRLKVLNRHSPHRRRRGRLPRRASHSGPRHGDEGAQGVPRLLLPNEQVSSEMDED